MVRIHSGVSIIQSYNQTQIPDIILHSVYKSPAKNVMSKRETHGMSHKTRRNGSGRHLPKFFDSNSPHLGIFLLHEIVALNEFFGQISPRPFT